MSLQRIIKEIKDRDTKSRILNKIEEALMEEINMENIPCRSIEDVEEQTANGEGNPIWQIDVLCGEIRYLQNKVVELQNAIDRITGKGE
ncbi:MAG: hypothetical protein WC455_21340 [Dehalococcoidia bacterium]|jgi:hypothetical protein